jgi:hypothetical protein
LLRESGYAEVYFDGVNRFYLAEERAGLAPRFSLPPNVWDDFETAFQLALRKENKALKAEVGRAQGQARQGWHWFPASGLGCA